MMQYKVSLMPKFVYKMKETFCRKYDPAKLVQNLLVFERKHFYANNGWQTDHESIKRRQRIECADIIFLRKIQTFYGTHYSHHHHDPERSPACIIEHPLSFVIMCILYMVDFFHVYKNCLYLIDNTATQSV